MDRAQQVKTVAEGAGAHCLECRRVAQQAQELVQGLVDEMAASGWQGVITTLRPAAEALEYVGKHADEAARSCESAATLVGAITEQMNTTDVQKHFAEAGNELRHASGELHEGLLRAEQALAACRDAGDLESALHAVGNTQQALETARESVDAAVSSAEDEAQKAETLGAAKPGN